MNRFLKSIVTGIIAGAAGALINGAAIEAVKRAGLRPGTGGLARLVFGHNLGPVGAEVFHFAMGIGMATTYMVFVRDLLPGPGWIRGLIFVQLPGIAQLFWVLPATGHGVAGVAISPATPFLAWALNALFGVVFGAIGGAPQRKGAYR